LIYNQHLTPGQLVDLYQGSDCFVLPTHGEGWGMTLLEAMACGTPAIATNWSAPTTFLTEANGYPLPSRGLIATGLDKPYYRDAQWADPDETALVDLLRHVAAHPDECRRKGQQAIQDVQQWTWTRAVDVVCERLAEV
jgi:hypothetical protein